MKVYTLTYSDTMELIDGLEKKFGTGFETLDGRNGTLIDSFIGTFNRDGYYPFTIMAIETYRNEWTSVYTVTIVRTERDNKKIDNLWNDFITEYDNEYEEV